MLRTKLLERQRSLCLKDDAMAKLIGIPRTSYTSLRLGKYRVSLEVAKKIVQAFPDLAEYAFVDEPQGADEASA